MPRPFPRTHTRGLILGRICDTMPLCKILKKYLYYSLTEMTNEWKNNTKEMNILLFKDHKQTEGI
jgi:hypothetical protein